MLTQAQIEAAAQSLYRAEIAKRQTGLISGLYPEMTMDEAYAIQDALVSRKFRDGRKQIGWKIGLTSKAMQRALNIDIPDSGVIFDDMHFPCGSVIPAGKFFEPRIEAEIAFVMGRDVSPDDLTRDEIVRATDHVLPALEILETRIVRTDSETGASRNVYDTICDNAANAGIVLADRRFKLKEVDIRWLGVILKRNGIVEETGLGAGILDDPVVSVLWLARRLAEYGQTIKKGDIVMAGSFIRPVEAPPGSEFFGDFGPFGTVTCKFQDK